MPSKLRKAIGAVKDQTSISLAKVSKNNSSNLEIAILKATTHDEVPIEDRYINEVLLLTSSSKIFAAASAQAIAKRISRTRNWIVALKSLMLVLQIFQNGDPQFPREVLHAMKRGAKILNLSSFRDDSNSSPWDYTAFVRTFALYLNERLNCFVTGNDTLRCGRRGNDPVRDMKPAMLLNRISNWQRLLDRVLATRPTGAAKTNRLVQISLYSVIRESFDLYRDISDGLALLLDSFFQMKYQSCVNAFETCVKASKQFEELCSFYSLCKGIGVGRTSEYPSVQKISDELIDTLQEFLKDQASFPTGNGRSQGPQLLLPAPTGDAVSNSDPCEASETFEHPEGISERDSDIGSELRENRTSLEDLISVTDAGTSPSVSLDQEQHLEQFAKRSEIGELPSGNELGTSSSISVNQGRYSGVDLLSFDDRPQQEEQEHQDQNQASVSDGARDCWELALMETTTNMSSIGFDSFMNSLYSQASLHQHQNNPFLQDTSEITATTTAPSFPTFQATPTFCAKNSSDTTATLQMENDPFATCPSTVATDQMFNGAINQQHLLHEQQLWLQHQNKIIARHIS